MTSITMFSVVHKELNNRKICINLEWDIYSYILWRHVSTVADSEQTTLQSVFRHYLDREAAES